MPDSTQMAKYARRNAAGIIIVTVFLAIVGCLYWLGPITSDNVEQDYFMQDPGPISLMGIPDNNMISQKFTILAEADAQWFFFGGMPVFLTDQKGNVIWNGVAELIGGYEDMSPDSVPFAIAIDAGRYVGPADIVIDRYNPFEDDPSYNKEFRVHVFISSTSTQYGEL